MNLETGSGNVSLPLCPSDCLLVPEYLIRAVIAGQAVRHDACFVTRVFPRWPDSSNGEVVGMNTRLTASLTPQPILANRDSSFCSTSADVHLVPFYDLVRGLLAFHTTWNARIARKCFKTRMDPATPTMDAADFDKCRW